MELRFIVDCNAGKLAKWLRIMGYDALFFNKIEDNRLIEIALREGRIVLTRDTQMMKRRVVTKGKLGIILLQSDDPREQSRQVIRELKLNCRLRQFTRCLECNQDLSPRHREEVKELVPPYVYLTQTQFMQCPSCQRVYWRGTHWQRMNSELEKIAT